MAILEYENPRTVFQTADDLDDAAQKIVAAVKGQGS